MRVMLASAAGSPDVRNDDWAGATSTGIAVVLDGLSEAGPTGCHHGTGWYVHQLGARLLALAAEPALTLADALAGSIDTVAAAHRDDCDLGHPGSPAATVAVVRPRGRDGLEYLVLSDAVVVLDQPAEPVAITDLSVRGHIPEAVDFAALITAQQVVRNRPEGYWVAQHDPAAAAHAIVGNADGLAGALLLSDGAAAAVTAYSAVTWRELLDVAYEKGPGDAIALTRELERQDRDHTVWPRHKTHDDATVIVWRP
jgi:hypothetical protein